MNRTNSREEQLTRELLEAICQRSDLSQRNLAKHMGVALGLANTYLKRCVRKGYVKITQAPANRYLYYLTPIGFAEKSRLTARYLAASLDFVRLARASCSVVYRECRQRGMKRVILCGDSELAEIAFLESIEARLEILGLYDGRTERKRFFSKPIWRGQLPQLQATDAALLTDLTSPVATYRRLEGQADSASIMVPSVLGTKDQLEHGID